jgi:hypothetical protein
MAMKLPNGLSMDANGKISGVRVGKRSKKQQTRLFWIEHKTKQRQIEDATARKQSIRRAFDGLSKIAAATGEKGRGQ